MYIPMNKLIIVFLFITQFSIAQDYIYFGDDRFESTPTWFFYPNIFLSNSPAITIAKHQDFGLLFLELESFSGNQHRTGTLSIYLSNGDVIKCYDRGITDCLNNKCTTKYFLTIAEINKIQHYRINSVRYQVFSKSISANNQKSLLDETEYPTEHDVRDLFKTQNTTSITTRAANKNGNNIAEGYDQCYNSKESSYLDDLDKIAVEIDRDFSWADAPDTKYSVEELAEFKEYGITNVTKYTDVDYLIATAIKRKQRMILQVLVFVILVIGMIGIIKKHT